jgi:hypothetical protein
MRALLATTGCLLVFGCTGGESSRQDTASGSANVDIAIDGTWTGKTSQDRLIEFVVKDRVVSSLKLAMSLKLDAVCARPGSPVAVDYRGGEAEATFAKPVPVTSNKFTVETGVSDVDARVQAEFSQAGATGTIELQATPASGCSGKDRLTWSATRVLTSK